MHELEDKQDSYAHILANDVTNLITAYRGRLPELDWSAIQKALDIVQTSLEIAKISENTEIIRGSSGSDTIY